MMNDIDNEKIEIIEEKFDDIDIDETIPLNDSYPIIN